MQEVRHALWQGYKGLSESVRSAHGSSTFEKDKRLTPSEYVAAGDFLVHAYPTWSWEAGDASETKSHLPKDQQYLITRNVPCYQRAAAVTGVADQTEALIDIDGEESWLAPERCGPAGAAADDDIPTIGEDPRPAAQEEEDDSIPDIDDLELADDEADQAALPAEGRMQSATEPDNIRRTRTYDIMITYDKYHAVPSIWLVGYDEDRQPLKPQQIMEDISSDHARKTATVDRFPHARISAVGIHPCKHADTMKRLCEMHSAGGGKSLQVDHYMVLFLKFIASVVPTIEYDYTSSAGEW